MSNFQGNGTAPAQGETKPSNPLDDRTFKVDHQNTNTNRIDYLSVDMQDNCVRLYGDVSHDGSGQWASLKLPLTDWGMFKQSLQRIALAKEPDEETFEGYTGGINDLKLAGSITISRTIDGIVTLTLKTDQGQSKVYSFTNRPHTRILDRNRQPLSPSEASRRRAIAWKDEVSDLIQYKYRTDYKSYNERRDANGQPRQPQKQWNGQKQWNNGGGQQKQWNGQKQWNNGGGQKQWGGQQKQWNNNGGGQQKQWQPPQQTQAPAPQQHQGPEPSANFSEYLPENF